MTCPHMSDVPGRAGPVPDNNMAAAAGVPSHNHAPDK